MTIRSQILENIEDYKKELKQREREYRALDRGRSADAEYLDCAIIHLREFVDVLTRLLDDLDAETKTPTVP